MRVPALTILIAALCVAATGALAEAEGQNEMDKPVTFKAASAVLKAPVHTCVIKYYPGLKQFVRDRAPDFKKGRLDVQAYSQPPNFNLYSADGEHSERIEVHNDATSEEIEAMLARWGVSPGDGGQDPTDVNECGMDDL